MRPDTHFEDGINLFTTHIRCALHEIITGVDRYGNERSIWFKSEGLKAPRGKFNASLTAKALNKGTPGAILTLGFSGKELKQQYSTKTDKIFEYFIRFFIDFD